MLNLNSLLAVANIDPAKVLVMRHRPFEPKLRKWLPTLAVKKPELYRAYQQAQYPRAEAAMSNAEYVASFVGLDDSRSVFCYLYANRGSREINEKQFWKMQSNQELHEIYGMTGWVETERETVLWFDLKKTDILSEYFGKLEITWPPPAKSWYRWAHRNTFQVSAIHQESALDGTPIDWKTLSLEWPELSAIPKSWEEKLSQWRGIYLIENMADGKFYVGSAYGEQNIFGRWKNYAKSGDGGNKLLKKLDPAGFRFSILQITAHDLGADEIVQIENSWKTRLNTFAPRGLNLK